MWARSASELKEGHGLLDTSLCYGNGALQANGSDVDKEQRWGEAEGEGRRGAWG